MSIWDWLKNPIDWSNQLPGKVGTKPAFRPLADRLIRAAAHRNAILPVGANLYNIIYAEGMNPDGTPNGHTANFFDDTRFLVRRDSIERATIIGAWEATTRPGYFWTRHRMNPDGAFHIDLGYQEAWTMGTYHDMQALLQARPIRGTRDANNAMDRSGFSALWADIGVHHHGGYDYPHDDLGKSSAGCLVGRSMSGHQDFMDFLHADSRFKLNRNFLFSATVLTAQEVLAA